ncbi:hypothetical protein J5N97_011765 [Dioscorea zingiberensis]|uniref:BHLH domain-containing protein n=1 Tax=Dioscorea zingiberensis TaxID=325984 RepID=A0A9D5D151_9LILI|nr:hypothetical protein J5N97_011765 [Dioscorea zingiberensis]
MSDEFQLCNGSWWNTPRIAAASTAASISCSTATADTGATAGGGFSWASSETVEHMEGKQRSGEEPVASCSGSSVTYQETHKMDAGGCALIDASLQVPGFGLSSPMMDWNQASLLSGRSSGRAETSFHAMLQEDMAAMDCNQEQRNADDSSVNLFKDMNHGYLLDQHHYTTLVPASYGYSSSSQTVQLPQQPPEYESSSMAYRPNELLQASWAKFPQFLKSSPVLKHQPLSNQLHFSNNTPFWNASAGAAGDVRSPFYSSVLSSQFMPQSLEQKPININNSLSIKGSLQKPRIETPSPLPTFKVRKEKLGDRITALQQLVSPFGKTDTASVLHEAIEYIKFLHEQVGVLSTSYLKNGHPIQQHQHQNSEKLKDNEGTKQDLRSRGLCLVPISSTFPVTRETPADFWTPTFGGTYR